MSAPLPAREARDPEAKADLRRGSMSSPTGSYPSPQTLNPSPLPSGGRVQRAQPSLAGGWGVPPNPYPLRFPSGKWADSASGRPHETGSEDGRTPARRESPERAQPSLAGAWGYPPTPTRSASRQGSGRTSGAGTGAWPCAPTRWDRNTAGHPIRRESPEGTIIAGIDCRIFIDRLHPTPSCYHFVYGFPITLLLDTNEEAIHVSRYRRHARASGQRVRT